MDDILNYLKHYWMDALSNTFPTYFNGECESDARLDNKVAVITGCNTGIGKITALEFYKRGARVIMACRNLEKARIAADDIKRKAACCGDRGEIVIRKLNLASYKSVRDCAQQILAIEDNIHILINNAGIFCPWEVTEDGKDLLFQTNYLGHFLFTMLLLPRIINAAPARIVNVSSLLYTWAKKEVTIDDETTEQSYSPFYAYARSKLAIILFTMELAERLKGSGVTTYSVHPGMVHTEIFRQTDVTIHPTFRRIFEGNISKKFFHKSPRQGAQTTLHCALSEKAGKQTGMYYSDCRPRRPVAKARDKKKAKTLWDFSWSTAGLSEDYNPFVWSDSQEQDQLDQCQVVGQDLISKTK